MKNLLEHISRYPLVWFLLINFVITWCVWLLVPTFMGSDWTQQKLMVAAGFGPAPAALIITYAQGHTITINSNRWRGWFFAVFVLLFGLNASSVLYGDGITADIFAKAHPSDISLTTLIVLFLSSGICAFVTASLVCNSSKNLNSLVTWPANKYYLLVALLLPTLWCALGLATNIVTDTPVVWFSNDDLETLVWLGYIVRSFLFTLLVVAIGEEAGWRGWMLPHLQQRFSPLMSTVIIGVCWGLWHWPLYMIGQYPDEPVMVFAKVGVCIMLGVFFTWLYNRSGGNLLLMVLLHTALNNTNRIIPMTENAGLYLLLIFVAMIYLDKMWKKRPD
ncbi:CPBP family intramembrane glutamic endopeptidase [Thalassotalea nanhaiensis]|uniref:CPBP family intramembrane glutamic endopeptidase n=1 Tax=Thalassotalea nanhaiensis TaxID=3065648 RepID=A0ABY9TF90_9GAMM|nr:CPBP family intramembrane glutamic endopeptidase [Colwelliaceae bacterium SQ345]